MKPRTRCISSSRRSRRAAQKVLSSSTSFRKFASSATVMDLAVGVIIGAAVGKLVESLVKHVMMPLVSA